MTDELTDQERAVLQLADSGREGGSFLNGVRDLGYQGETAYWRVLNALIETEKALAAYPLLVGRLRRLRAGRTARRGYR